MGHVIAQLVGHASAQAQGDRFVRGLEIIHIAPIRNLAPRRGELLLEQFTQQRLLADAGAAQQEDVVAVVGNLQTQGQGLHCAVLAQVFP